MEDRQVGGGAEGAGGALSDRQVGDGAEGAGGALSDRQVGRWRRQAPEGICGVA